MVQPAFFLDRGLGARIVPRLLREAGWTLQTMDERYGVDRSSSIADTAWIADIAEDGYVGISKDRNIARNGVEVDAVRESACRLLLLPNAQMTSADMTARLLRQEGRIAALVERRPGPWIAVVQRQSVELLSLFSP